MSRHDAALSLLLGWQPPSAAQHVLQQRFTEHLRSHPDGLDRTCRPAHLTAGAVVLSADHDRVLLTLHARARRWFQLGGHIEPGDPTLAAAAAREAHEESGLDGLLLDPDPVQLSEHAVEFCGPPGTVLHLDVRFLAVAGKDVVPLVSDESLDVRWWPVDALPEPEPELVELVAQARARAQSTASRASASLPGGGSSRAAADHPTR